MTKEELSKRVFDHTALVQQMTKVIELSIYMGMKDLPNLLPTRAKVKTNVQNIERACKNITLNLNSIVTVKDDFAEIMENDHAYELYRLCRNMFFVDTNDLKQFNDGVVADIGTFDPLITNGDLKTVS